MEKRSKTPTANYIVPVNARGGTVLMSVMRNTNTHNTSAEYKAAECKV